MNRIKQLENENKALKQIIEVYVGVHSQTREILKELRSESELTRYGKNLVDQALTERFPDEIVTHDVLIDHGFVKNDNGSFKNDEDDDRSVYYSIQIGNNLNLTINLDDQVAGIDLEWRAEGSALWVCPTTLHKLKDLYRALTSQELLKLK